MCSDERGRINRRECLSVGMKEGRVTVYREAEVAVAGVASTSLLSHR